MTVYGHPALRDLAKAIVASGGLGCEQETLYDLVPSHARQGTGEAGVVPDAA